MKKITDIIQKAAHPTSVDAKEFFCKTLKEYIHAKYNGIDESTDIKKFTEDYHSYLTALEGFQDPKSKSAKSKNDSLISNNIKHWLRKFNICAFYDVAILLLGICSEIIRLHNEQ